MESLIRLEKELLPFAIVENHVDFNLLTVAFPEYAESVLKLIGEDGYSKKDFSVTKHKVEYLNAIYYVLVLWFPFNKEHRYVGLGDRAFVIYAPGRLEKMHYFLSALREYGNYDGTVKYALEPEEYIPEEESMLVKPIQFAGILDESDGVKDWDKINAVTACGWAFASEDDTKVC